VQTLSDWPNEGRWSHREGDSTLRGLAYAAEAVVVLAGMALGTVSLCGLIANGWGLIGWAISVVSAVRIISISRVDSPSIIVRVLLASVSVFCLVSLAAMATAPGPIQPVDKTVILGLFVVAFLGAAGALMLARK
jgi:hypothetical protein